MVVRIDKNKLNDAIEAICDDYCKWPDECPDQERLDRHCEECPLMSVYEHPYGRNDWQE